MDHYHNVHAGGITCADKNTISNCCNTGNISAVSNTFSTTYAGGISSGGGLSKGDIADCFNTGDVSASSSQASAYAGGGYGYSNGTTAKTVISNFYNTGMVSASSSSPKEWTEQWASEFLQIYPSANILVVTKKDFEAKNRKKFCARIATGDYDAVIMGHSQFEKIPMSIERQERMLKQQIDEILDAIDEVKRNKGERYTIKQMERLKKSLEVRLAKLTDQSRKDDVVTFEELGIDRLFIESTHR